MQLNSLKKTVENTGTSVRKFFVLLIVKIEYICSICQCFSLSIYHSLIVAVDVGLSLVWWGKGGGGGESGTSISLQAMDNLESSRIYFQWTRADLATKLELLILVLDFSNQS